MYGDFLSNSESNCHSGTIWFASIRGGRMEVLAASGLKARMLPANADLPHSLEERTMERSSVDVEITL